MSDSGDIELLDKRASLIRDLLGKLDRRREERRRGVGDSLSRSGPETAGPQEQEAAPAPLRLVTSTDSGAPPAAAPEPRRPHFRQKRSWNLSGAGPNGEASAGAARSVTRPVRREAAPQAVERGDQPGETVPWRVFEQLRRERDDLLVQLMRLQSVEQRLFEERAAVEEKDAEIRRLRHELESRRNARFDAALHRLYRRLAEVEEVHRMLVHRALAPAPGAERIPGMKESEGTARDAAKKLWIRGHEIVVTTSRKEEGEYYSFALLMMEENGKQGMKGFKATASSSREAELECIDLVLGFLEERAGVPVQRLPSSRNLATVRGRQVDIFCDLVGEGKFQAFPFLYDAHGRRNIILQFHLDEAITGVSPEESRLRCVKRLEEHFDEIDRLTGRGNPRS